MPVSEFPNAVADAPRNTLVEGRLTLVRVEVVAERSLRPYTLIDTPTNVARLFRELVDVNDREHFLAFYLDTRQKLNAVHTVSVGSVNASIVHPREVFKGALLANAAALVVAHNHPSNEAEPSPEDFAVTARLVDAGTVLGIELQDHVVVTQDSWYSMRQHGTGGL